MTVRWRLVDPQTAEEYTFPQNPREMTSPHLTRQIQTMGTTGGTILATEAAQSAKEWSFRGTIRTQAFYDELLAWSRKKYRLFLYDHLNRQYSVIIQNFDPTPKKSGSDNYWLFTYSMSVLVVKEWQ